jgi:hypothetical protein
MKLLQMLILLTNFLIKIEPDKKCMARCQDHWFFPPEKLLFFGQDNCEIFGKTFFFFPIINLTNFAKMLGKLRLFSISRKKKKKKTPLVKTQRHLPF